MDIPVWGEASARTEVIVKFANQQVETKANEAGVWRVSLQLMEAGGPFDLEIKSGEEKIEIENVMLGEVWLPS